MKYLKRFEKIYNEYTVKVGDVIKLVSDTNFETDTEITTQIGEVTYVFESGVILDLIFEYYGDILKPNDVVCGKQIYPGFQLLNKYARELTEEEILYLDTKKYNL